MFSGSTTTQRFFQVVGNICSDKNAFAVSHLLTRAPLLDINPALQNRSISRILYPDFCRDGDHSSRLAVADPLKRPTRRSYPDESGFGRAALVTPPYLVLHCEEFAWPRMSPHAPVRSYIKPLRAAPFHPSLAEVFRELVCFLLHLSSPGNLSTAKRPAVSGLAAL